ncbi:MAG: DUF2637 domain-containing protein [Actinomycetota bacterium]|nr:DUF2637 domain-containing protein [Actinomycetota bacterium]
MTNTRATHLQPQARGRWLIWTAGLVVAVGAAIATAHGLYEVAIAAMVPPPIAWLYPLITDGLALVAYASTTRLATRGRGYAWLVVVLAAGLSGLAQASYLAIGVHTAPTELRFGVGAWPAIAAAITAHLLYLLAAVQPEPSRRVVRTDPGQQYDPDELYDQAAYDGVRPVRPEPVTTSAVRPDVVRDNGAVRAETGRSPSYLERFSGPVPPAGAGIPDGGSAGHDGDLGRSDGPQSQPHPAGSQPRNDDSMAGRAVRSQPGDVGHPWPVRPNGTRPYDTEHPLLVRMRESQPDDRTAYGSSVQPVRPSVRQPVPPDPASYATASDNPGSRARAAALAHLRSHGAFPTVSALMELADVGRGTAGLALKQLREQPAAERPGLLIVGPDDQTGTSE